MYVYIYIYICVCVYAYVCVCINIDVCVCKCVDIFIGPPVYQCGEHWSGGPGSLVRGAKEKLSIPSIGC